MFNYLTYQNISIFYLYQYDDIANKKEIGMDKYQVRIKYSDNAKDEIMYFQNKKAALEFFELCQGWSCLSGHSSISKLILEFDNSTILD